MTTSESGSILSKRSSSQTSHISSDSKKARAAAGRPRRSLSKSSNTPSPKPDPSLTSFPSFSPEQGGPQDAATQDAIHKPLRTVSQRFKDRKATLAGLTSGSPASGHPNALFDDSPRSSMDIPGALHLAGDDHINRLIARTGAVKLVRQFAQDLAQRDVEMTALRTRADNRERELKKLLREADVPSAEIEKRLLRLEQTSDNGDKAEGINGGGEERSTNNINGMMHEAMSAEVGVTPEIAGSPPALLSSAAQSLKSAPTATHSRHESLSELPPDSISSSRKTSRTGSIASQDRPEAEATVKAKVPSSKPGGTRGLEEIFQPPGQSTSYFIGGVNKTVKKAKPGDAASIRSNQSSSSFASWTKLFGGKSQARKGEVGRPRASSVEQKSTKDTPKATPGSALASLSKVRNSATLAGPHASRAANSTTQARPTARRTPTASRLSTSPNHARKDSNASDFPPTVEMDSMIESSQLPPTMTSYNHEVEGLLTDRFGFIYDQRQRKRQNTTLLKHKRNRLSGAETLGSYRSDVSDEEGPKSAKLDGKFLHRPSSPASVDGDSKKSWQDYLKVSSALNVGRPRELLSHTPSAGAVVTVSTVDGTITPPTRKRSTSISISANAQKALPSSSLVSAATPSTVTVTSTDAGGQTQEVDTDATISDQEPVKLLLDQLKELHDTLQAEKTVKWNDFLRRVRAERNTSTDRNTKNAPEADLLNGELVGIATLGRSSKTKAKYLHFKSLVLAGIPVTLRPKIWAECSGAFAHRIPGYYDDLVARSEEGSDVDTDIANQIKADIRRTLTDNTFFRHGPGVQRLEELLRAYSLHNPRIGYCQGMNLITASLLLICATPEDCFWLLVAIIDHILPSGYFDQSLLVARADQLVLRGYVAEVLPKLDAKLQDLGVELEACTFHWFLSMYTAVLTGGEALYRVWDVVICLHSLEDPANAVAAKALAVDGQPPAAEGNSGDESEHDGTSSPFLFQLSLALLKLNEAAILALDQSTSTYSYLNHNMTNHAISVDGLIQAAEALRSSVRREDVLERRRAAVKDLKG